jgi:glycosyltransferase involved in cell wall biosynthesis
MQILVNDFIGGALDRGIPLYVRNLIEGLRDEGLHVRVVRAPAICRKLPRGVLYLTAVFVEQTLLPAIGFVLRADLTIYPYNSVAVIDLLTRRGRIVVHDLEQLNRPVSFSKLYYLFCYRAVKWFNAPLFAISEMTRQRLAQSGLFGSGPVTLLPNTFYAFERLVAAETPQRSPSILLCTGSTANKDLETVVAEYLPNVLAQGHCVSVFGLHKAADMAKLQPVAAFMASGQLRVCGRLSDEEVARAYRSHDIVWVHSLREGFGRCVVEGRLAGARVLATDIAEFTELRDGDVYLYSNPARFFAELDRLVHMTGPAAPYTGYPYRELLRRAVEDAMLAKPAPGAARSPQAI